MEPQLSCLGNKGFDKYCQCYFRSLSGQGENVNTTESNRGLSQWIIMTRKRLWSQLLPPPWCSPRFLSLILSSHFPTDLFHPSTLPPHKVPSISIPTVDLTKALDQDQHISQWCSSSERLTYASLWIVLTVLCMHCHVHLGTVNYALDWKSQAHECQSHT